MKRITALVIGLLLLVVSGCGGDGAPSVNKGFTLTATDLTITRNNAPSLALELQDLVPPVQKDSSLIEIKRDANFNEAVKLELVGLPADVTAKYNANPVAGDSTFVRLSAGFLAPFETTEITVKGTSKSGATAQAKFNLTIKKAEIKTPKILWITPNDGTKGVHDDVIIVVKFNTEMNTSSVEAAYYSKSTGLRPKEVKFSWNYKHNELRIKPNKKLQYHDIGSNLNGSKYEYSFGFSNKAKDTHNQSIENPQKVKFYTLRRYHHNIVATLSATIVKNTRVERNKWLYVGDSWDKNLPLRAVIGFDIKALPSTQDLEYAKLWLLQSEVRGTPCKELSEGPYAYVNHVDIGTSIEKGEFDTTPLDGVGELSGECSKLDEKHVVVTDSIKSDLDQRAVRGNRSQFRIEFELETDGDNQFDYLKFYSSREVDKEKRPTLEVVYLIE